MPDGPCPLFVVEQWIDLVSSEHIPPLHAWRFYEMSCSLFGRCMFLERDAPRQAYQLYATSCMFIASCFYAPYPFSMETLHSLCVETYPRSEIAACVHSILGSISPGAPVGGVDLVRNLCARRDTEVDLVRVHDRQLVRKRIHHPGMLPRYHAVVEVLVHFRLRFRYRNTARLVHTRITTDWIDLFYEYAPNPLGNYFKTPAPERIVLGILSGVESMHAAQVYHRDLKPDNIHVDPDGDVRILDVGSSGHCRVRTTVPVCTISHRAPEILAAEVTGTDVEYDAGKVDVWSVGVLICQLYLGRDVMGTFSTQTSCEQALRSIHQHRAAALRRLSERLSSRRLSMVSRCLDDLPSNRPTIQELKLAFNK